MWFPMTQKTAYSVNGSCVKLINLRRIDHLSIMQIQKMRKEDIQGYIDCESRIWESLKGNMPEEFIERNLSWIKRDGAKDAWMRVIDDPNWIVLVAVDEGSVIGMIQGRVDWSRLSSLGFLGVDDRHRRKGIAKTLLDSYTEESKNKGAEKISLYTSPTLKPAVKLYAERGFIPEGFLSRHRLGVDMIIYSKFLTP